MNQSPLTVRALNRALLARQMLLQREKLKAAAVVEKLIGLQAQQTRAAFIGLWSRIEGFERQELLKLCNARKVIKASMMRVTLHLMTAKDYLAFRQALQPMLSFAMNTILNDRAADLPLETILAAARDVLTQRPHTFTELRAHLVKSCGHPDERAMGFAVRTLLPLVSLPSDHTWGFPPDSSFTLAETWIGRTPAPDSGMEALVLRYLAAFGPATTGDFQSWSGLKGAQTVFEALRPQLATFKDTRKRELFDLPKAPRPAEDTPAPPCFVAPFDNLILGHADRSRIVPPEYRANLITKNLQIPGTLLVDGFVAGSWKSAVAKNTATLTVTPFAPLPKPARKHLALEAESLVRFMEPDAAKFEIKFD